MSEVTETQPVSIQGATKSTQSEIIIEPWPPAKRRKQAIKWLVISWVLALVTLPIPLVHLITVPVFIILGPVLFFQFNNKKSVVLGGQGPCPECEGRVSFSKRALEWPIKEVCDKNYDHVEIHPVS